jgi:hypothetical protein
MSMLRAARKAAYAARKRGRLRPMTTPRRLLLASPALLLAACAVEPAATLPGITATPAAPEPPPEPLGNAVARVEIRQWQLGMIGQVGWGEGVLIQGRTRRNFRIRSLGAGGVGMARIRATGEVFNMPRQELFAGTWGQARSGVVMPGAQMRGAVWLENTNRVRMRLIPNRSGLAAQLGVDGLLIEFT